MDRETRLYYRLDLEMQRVARYGVISRRCCTFSSAHSALPCGRVTPCCATTTDIVVDENVPSIQLSSFYTLIDFLNTCLCTVLCNVTIIRKMIILCKRICIWSSQKSNNLLKEDLRTYLAVKHRVNPGKMDFFFKVKLCL